MPSRILEPLLRALCAIAVAALVACASPRGVARNASADAEVGRHLQRGQREWLQKDAQHWLGDLAQLSAK